MRKTGIVGLWAFCFLLTGCLGGGGGDFSSTGSPPAASPVVLRAVLNSAKNNAPVTSCPSGGVTVNSGLDANINGVLDANEIATAQYVCNGINGLSGLNALSSITTEAPGANCINGGNLVSVGQDANANGVLEPSESSSSAYICFAVNGTNGINGLNALVKTSAEPSGVSCPKGGLKMTMGPDANTNAVLDPGEVTATSYVCNGNDGTSGTNGLASLTKSVVEVAGANCVVSGVKITAGLDANANAVLDPGEVTATSYVCNGTDGTSGTNGASGTNGLHSLTVATAEATGINCTNGGTKLMSGTDLNSSGVLDAGEVSSTSYACNGANGSSGASGLTSLTRTVAESSGINCTNGGLKVTTGVDANSSGVLDAVEVTTTNFVCNGSNGSVGAAGLNVLNSTVPEALGVNCSNGGLKVMSGSDTNANSVLESGEVTSTSYVCNGTNGTSGANGTAGTNGLTSLTAIVGEAAGANCIPGGLKVTSGSDVNANSLLDAGEVTTTRYVCDGLSGATGLMGATGATGLNSLIYTAAESAGVNCPVGGTKVTSGLDTNSNAVLDGPEVLTTSYMCHGTNGTNGLACWDLDGDRVQDPEEDTTGDGLYDAYDCNSKAIPAGVSVYRWNVWSTYDQGSGGWLGGNTASLFGGVTPSNWTDGTARAHHISSSGDVLRTLFSLGGRSGNNATVVVDSWSSASSTNGKMAGALFRIRNTTAAPIIWTPNFYYTSYSGYGEVASVAINGVNSGWNPFDSGGSQNAGVALTFPANQTSTVIFIVASGPVALNMRTVALMFYNNSLALPAGLTYKDDLDTVVTGW